MLENWRYNRALKANAKHLESNSREIFLEQEYQTQKALELLGIRDIVCPSDVSKVDSLFISPELISNLRVPYAVEVLGMPRGGKSTSINRYLTELWSRNERHKLVLVDEGARSNKQEYGDLRYSNPFLYSLLGGTATFVDYISSLKNINTGTQMVVSDRGQIDRRTFRRALFSCGDVNPAIMANEGQFMYGLENTPIQIGGIIMLMIRPEESLKRSKKLGPITNMDFLPKLYEQYWRLHWELIQGELPCRMYTCINAEKNQEEVYGRFKNAMDTALNIHKIYLTTLAKAFPEKFDRAKAEYDKSPQKLTRAQQVPGKKLAGRVLIVGGDGMRTDDEVLQNSVIEGYRLK